MITRHVNNWDVDLVSDRISEVFNQYLNEINYPYKIDFRSAFDREDISKVNDFPIFTWKITQEKPAVVKGEPLKGVTRKASYDSRTTIMPDGNKWDSWKLETENLVLFEVFSVSPGITRDVIRHFRNFLILSRQLLREGLHIADLYFNERKKDDVININGTLLYTAGVELYVKSLIIVMEQTDLIRRVRQFVSQE
jgi:hypothetical protein